MTDPAALTEQVREGIRWLEATSIGDRGHALVSVLRDGHWQDEHSIGCKPCAAHAALDALAEALAKTEKALREIAHMDDPSADRNDDLIYGSQSARIARSALAALAAGRDGGQ